VSGFVMIQLLSCSKEHTATTGLGDYCESDDDCRPGLVCPVETPDATSTFGLNQCSIPCATDADCPPTDCNSYSCDTSSARPVCLNWGCS
jgi:hypothetical protein